MSVAVRLDQSRYKALMLLANSSAEFWPLWRQHNTLEPKGQWTEEMRSKYLAAGMVWAGACALLSEHFPGILMAAKAEAESYWVIKDYKGGLLCEFA